MYRGAVSDKEVLLAKGWRLLIMSPSRNPVHDSRGLRLSSYLSENGWLVGLMWVQSSSDAKPELPEYVKASPCIVRSRFFRDESGRTRRIVSFLKTLWVSYRVLNTQSPEFLWISGFSSLVLATPYIVRHRGVRFVYDAREFSLGQHEYVGKKHKSFVQRLTIEAILAIEQWASRNAAAIIHTNKWRKRLFGYLHPIACEKSFVIENLHDGTLDVAYQSPPHASTIAVGYVGALGEGRGLYLLLDALQLLPPEYGVTIVGTGSESEKARLLGYALQQHVEGRLELVDAVPYWKLQDLCRTFSCGVLLIEDNCLNNRYCSPNKIFDFIAASCPSVMTDVPPLRYLAGSWGIGVTLAAPVTPRAVAAAIQKAVETRDLFRQRCDMAAQNLEWRTQSGTVEGVLTLLRGLPK